MPLEVPHPIVEALEVLGNDNGLATGHYYVIQPEYKYSAEYRKWEYTSLAAWQLFINRLGIYARFVDFYPIRQLDGSLLHQVAAAKVGAYRWVYIACPRKNVMREAMWVGAADNFIQPVRSVENCEFEPIMVGNTIQVLNEHLNSMWMPS
ncbi:hypothetical protein V5799_024845 [Amblyomma americanum]|uniref:Uncharacterized protein n=1 Tax=Amblyomma americanum TaxID=6943 RepID=A0AAQ4EBE9_AMBAM